MTHRCLSILGSGMVFSLLTAQHVFGAVTVLTVPWDPCPDPSCRTAPTTPHTSYPINSTTESTIIMGATVPSAVGSSDKFMVDWHFGDGSPDATFALTNPYDISTTHQYPASAAVGTIWTATVTVTDTTTSTNGSANYYVIQESNDCTKLDSANRPVCLASRVNVAIDWGLWYMHQTMWRSTSTAGGKTVSWGGWDGQPGSSPCPTVKGNAWDCGAYGSIDASNVQAFEVNGHLQNGPSTDPYSDDVARGLARMTLFIANEKNLPVTYNYDPAKQNYTCADHTLPQTSDAGACTGHGGRHYYNPSATACTSPPCKVTYDGNGNGLMAYSMDGSGEYSYTTSPFLDALVATGTPNAVAQTGNYAGDTFATIVQDIMDFYGYSQYFDDYDVDRGYARGTNQSQGGAWLYGPQQGDDNSTSQWAAIGFISGFRGFGLTLPASVTDFNQVWITNAQDLQESAPTGPDPYSKGGDNLGAYGYRGSLRYSNAAGPFAVTPSAMVQMAMDGVGRSHNTAFGDATTDFDQRWNTTETYYADNFCNAVSPYNQVVNAPRAYMYGLYSFTKSMLLHNAGGSLAPIQYLRTETPNVFTGNPNVPANSIDWYAALSAANGGKDPCDGVAQTLVSYQSKPVYGTFDGHWFGNTYYISYSTQAAYETSWALIMLQQTVFVSCVKNLVGRGAPSGSGPPSVTLTWTNQANATSYVVARSSTLGGPYTSVGSSSGTTFVDRTSGLSNGSTYYYVVLPQIGSAEVCQSNQASIKIPQ
ncbi:MAG: hypothetical protein JO061_07365 [Acidobacteriaceae bacterium]|nr:hypothetical protein [Acidobacteriaceae bacterium]